MPLWQVASAAAICCFSEFLCETPASHPSPPALVHFEQFGNRKPEFSDPSDQNSCLFVCLIIYMYLYEGFAGMYVMCATFVCGVGRGQKRVSDGLKIR